MFIQLNLWSTQIRHVLPLKLWPEKFTKVLVMAMNTLPNFNFFKLRSSRGGSSVLGRINDNQ
jgi:hypothetical protein